MTIMRNPDSQDTDYMQIAPNAHYDNLAREYNVIPRLLNLFFHLAGPMFKPTLTLSKFLGLREFGYRREELEILYMKSQSGGGLDFYAFVEAAEAIAKKSHQAPAIQGFLAQCRIN